MEKKYHYIIHDIIELYKIKLSFIHLEIVSILLYITLNLSNAIIPLLSLIHYKNIISSRDTFYIIFLHHPSTMPSTNI